MRNVSLTSCRPSKDNCHWRRRENDERLLGKSNHIWSELVFLHLKLRLISLMFRKIWRFMEICHLIYRRTNLMQISVTAPWWSTNLTNSSLGHRFKVKFWWLSALTRNKVSKYLIWHKTWNWSIYYFKARSNHIVGSCGFVEIQNASGQVLLSFDHEMVNVWNKRRTTIIFAVLDALRGVEVQTKDVLARSDANQRINLRLCETVG